MSTTRILSLSAIALALAIPTAQAEDRVQPEAARLGEHRAVIVARRGVPVDPARLSWSLQQPLSGDEPSQAVLEGGGQQIASRP